MFHKILVPLDGSSFAKQALPIAARIARCTGASLLLVRVCYPQLEYTYYPQIMFSQEDLDCQLGDTEVVIAQQYLHDIAQLDLLAGIKVETQTATSISTAPTILEVAHKAGVDLIILSSHGRTGLKRWVMGSVAQKISRSSSIPVFIVHKDDELNRVFVQDTIPVHVMVALDGSELAEKCLLPAAYLCAALSSPAQGILQLTHVIRLPSSFEYGQDDCISRALKKETPLAQKYLQSVEKRFQEEPLRSINIKTTIALAHNIDVALQILEMAEYGAQFGGHDRCQLIALTTHGRSGLQRWMKGSVTERILSSAQIPLLIVSPLIGSPKY